MLWILTGFSPTRKEARSGMKRCAQDTRRLAGLRGPKPAPPGRRPGLTLALALSAAILAAMPAVADPAARSGGTNGASAPPGLAEPSYAVGCASSGSSTAAG